MSVHGSTLGLTCPQDFQESLSRIYAQQQDDRDQYFGRLPPVKKLEHTNQVRPLTTRINPRF